MAMSRSALFVAIVPLAAFLYLAYLFARPPWTMLRITGLALMIAGLLFLTVARFQLGSSFSVAPEARQLVTHGIYSRIRNPIYVFSSAAIAGLILFLERPYFLLALLILILLQIVRARAESRVLEEHFGDAYRQYKANTWF
jgi:protein-S-isoprenylcysteine O-methyltransferase Ste14